MALPTQAAPETPAAQVPAPAQLAPQAKPPLDGVKPSEQYQRLLAEFTAQELKLKAMQGTETDGSKPSELPQDSSMGGDSLGSLAESTEKALKIQAEQLGMKQPVGMDSAKPAESAAATPAATMAESAPPAQQTVTSGGDDKSRATYADLKDSANGDRNVSSNEDTALRMFADKVGIKEQPKKGLDQVLKDLLGVSMSNDGKIDPKEAKAIAAVVDAMGGKSDLSRSDVLKMLSAFMNGAEVDGEFSKEDLEAFGKLLSLVDAKPSDGGGSEMPGSGGGGSIDLRSAKGFAAQNRFGNLSNGFASQMRFMQAAAGGGAAGGGMQTAEDQQKSEKGASV
jgi:hypothetical protein